MVDSGSDVEITGSKLGFDSRHNVCAYLDQSHPSTEGFRDIISWLRRSKIMYAISHKTTVYQDLIEQFWKTAVYKVNVKPIYIRAKVNNEVIQVSEEVIREVLQLKDQNSDPSTVKDDDITHFAMKIGYEGGFDRRELTKSFLSNEWRYLASVFMGCLSPRKGGYGGLHFMWAGAMSRLCMNETINISHLIFSCMAGNAQSTDKKFLMYPRFVQMILDAKMQKKNWDSFKELKLSHFQTRVFADAKHGHATFSGKITPLLDHMYRESRNKQLKELWTLEAAKELAEKARKKKFRIKKKDEILPKSPPKRKGIVITESDSSAQIAVRSPSLAQSGAGPRDKGMQKMSAHEEEPPKKRTKFQRAALDEDLAYLVGEPMVKQISMLKIQIASMQEREDDREREVQEMRATLKAQRYMIEAHGKALVKAFIHIDELRATLNLSIEKDDIDEMFEDLLEKDSEEKEKDNDDDPPKDDPHRDRTTSTAKKIKKIEMQDIRHVYKTRPENLIQPQRQTKTEITCASATIG